MGPQSLSYGFLNEIMDHPCSDGGAGNDKIRCTNLMKDVSNLMKDILNFVKDVPRVPKCVLRWGSAPNHFFMGF